MFSGQDPVDIAIMEFPATQRVAVGFRVVGDRACAHGLAGQPDTGELPDEQDNPRFTFVQRELLTLRAAVHGRHKRLVANGTGSPFQYAARALPRRSRQVNVVASLADFSFMTAMNPRIILPSGSAPMPSVTEISLMPALVSLYAGHYNLEAFKGVESVIRSAFWFCCRPNIADLS